MPSTKGKLTAKQMHIVERIGRLHAKGEPLNITAVKRRHPKLIEQVYAVRPFWGWKRALEDGGISYGDIGIELCGKVTCRICGKEYVELFWHLRIVHDCTTEDYRADYPDASLVAETRRAQYMKRGRKYLLIPHWEPLWSPEYVLDRVAELHRLAHEMNYRAMFNRDTVIVHAVRAFGSWDAALRRVGLNPEKIRVFAPYRDWTRELFVERIRERYAKQLPMHHSAVAAGPDADYMLVTCAVRFFGSWDAALRHCGLNPREIRNPRPPCRYPSAEDVLKSIRQRRRKKLPINSNGVLKGAHKDRALHNTALKFFGSWGEALEAAGFNPQKITLSQPSPYPTEKAVIREIRRRSRAGLPLTVAALRTGKDGDGPLVAAALRSFGKWSVAVTTAGVSYSKRTNQWG